MSETPHAEPQHGSDETKRRSWVTAMFERIEHAISVSIGVILVFATLLVLTGTIAHMWTAIREWPETENIFQIVDKLLFVLMLVEILHTVRASITSMHLAVEPFLIVGLIATVRRILVVTLQTSGANSTTGHPAPSFEHAMIELGVLAGLTLVLITSIYLSRRSEEITNAEVKG
jgi:uncharacterized membrane protein (DUF373 family)